MYNIYSYILMNLHLDHDYFLTYFTKKNVFIILFNEKKKKKKTTLIIHRLLELKRLF